MPKSLLSRVALILMYFRMVKLSLSDEVTLRQLNIVFRHGDRTPTYTPELMPNDPYMDEPQTFYPMGYAGLTNLGKYHMYLLGKFLRQKYQDFLGNVYEEKKVYGLSSSSSRTKMSLQLVLAALYPPFLEKERWHKHLNWQPIPTYYREFETDTLFFMSLCDNFTAEHFKVMNFSEVQTQVTALQPFFNYVKELTGAKYNFTLFDVSLVQSQLECEQKLRLPMEPWMITLEADERLKKARLLEYKYNSYTKYLKRLNGGPFIREISENMLFVSNKTANYTRKISLYSGHDINIYGILSSLNIYKPHIPPYSAAIIFELLSIGETFYVKISYYKGSLKKLVDLTIPNCATLCPLDQFLNLSKDVRATDEDLKCKITGTGPYSKSQTLGIDWN